ncbi:hypothetical protein B0H12DRAFT_1130743 [Mycena haematopus]|nr:hypothetical protein B0H12DRAFT_1130743 [Mycena haematopus]
MYTRYKDARSGEMMLHEMRSCGDVWNADEDGWKMCVVYHAVRGGGAWGGSDPWPSRPPLPVYAPHRPVPWLLPPPCVPLLPGHCIRIRIIVLDPLHTTRRMRLRSRTGAVGQLSAGVVRTRARTGTTSVSPLNAVRRDGKHVGGVAQEESDVRGVRGAQRDD